MSTAAAATSWPELMTGLISESLRVVSAHSRHFLALSVLFLLPLSSLLIASPSLLNLFLSHNPSSSSSPPQSFLRFSSASSPSSPHHSPSPLSLLLLSLLLVLAVILLLSAFSSLAGSVRCGFFGRPVKLLSALARIPSSIPRLTITFFLLAIPLLILSPPFLLVLCLFPSPALILPISLLAFALLLHPALSFSIALPVSALEPSSGLKPLRRSTHLVAHMRLLAASLYMFFVPSIALVLWQCCLGEVWTFAGWREAVPVVARTVIGSALTAVLLLYWIVSSVVMYLYCKAVHGELAAEIAEEFAWEYVCLPFDETKVPLVVSVVRQ